MPSSLAAAPNAHFSRPHGQLKIRKSLKKAKKIPKKSLPVHRKFLVTGYSSGPATVKAWQSVQQTLQHWTVREQSGKTVTLTGEPSAKSFDQKKSPKKFGNDKLLSRPCAPTIFGAWIPSKACLWSCKSAFLFRIDFERFASFSF